MGALAVRQATKLARAMVTKYGMSALLGPTSIAYEDNGRSLSSETRAAVEAEARSTLMSSSLIIVHASVPCMLQLLGHGPVIREQASCLHAAA